MNNIQTNLIDEENFASIELFVNDLNRIRCVLLIYSQITSFSTDKKPTKTIIRFCCDEKDNEILLSMLKQHVPQLTTEKILIKACDQRFSSIVQDHFRNHGLRVSYEHPCYQMIYPKEIIEKQRITMKHSYPAGKHFRSALLSTQEAFQILLFDHYQ